MEKKADNFVKVYYMAYNEMPFDCDAIGYVANDNLLNWELHEENLGDWNDNDEYEVKEGYIVVFDSPDRCGDAWFVATENIYTRVYKESALTGGYGLEYPGGGLSATSGYDITAIIDDEKVMLQRYYF